MLTIDGQEVFPCLQAIELTIQKAEKPALFVRLGDRGFSGTSFPDENASDGGWDP